MSQFDVGSTIKSPRSKKDMPVNMSILDSMSQLEMLLQNTPDNRNRNGLYKPAFRNIEVERPSYGTSISSSTFNSPGISGLDMNAGNQGSAGFRNANLNENSNGYNNMYFASQNPGTRSGFADNQGTFGKKNDTSGFVRFDQQSDFGNQSQPQRNLDMPTSSNNGENRSGIGAFGAYRGNIDPFSNFGNQTQDSGFTTNTSRIAKPGNENNFGVRNQNQASPDLSQKMWPVSVNKSDLG